MILVDACARGGEPGEVYLLEPDRIEAEAPIQLEAHAMNPMNVLRAVQSMGGMTNRIVIVGCKPADFGPEEGKLGLSEPVAAAVGEAVLMIETLVARVLAGGAVEEVNVLQAG